MISTFDAEINAVCLTIDDKIKSGISSYFHTTYVKMLERFLLKA